MAKYQKKLEEDIRCPLEYGLAILEESGDHALYVYYQPMKN
ncbi:MAG: hypothetical protein ACLUTO_00930 [Anaerostipes sp.]